MKNNKEIDLIELFINLYHRRTFILKATLCGLFIGLIISISIPKTYTVSVTLSPESGNTTNGSLTGMASMLGINTMGGATQDALNPTMLPEIIKTTPFILDMYNIKINTKESTNTITLSQYVIKQKKPWWNYISSFPSYIIIGVKQLLGSSTTEINANETVDKFRLTSTQLGKINLIKKSLTASENKKSGMTVVSATFQDPEIAAIIADSAVSKLQTYIIDYRTRKAQDDCHYLEKLCKERKNEYLKAQQAYASFMDANRNVILQRTQAEGTRLQNEMSIAFQIYSQVETQLQMARAKVQEAKPVFAIVEPATVPLEASSPNKSLIIIACIFLGLIGSSIWILFGENFWNILKTTNIK